MKTKFLFLLLFASLFMPATAQQFKHFKVDTTAEMWRLSSIVSESSQEGFASQARFPYINMIDLVKNTVQGFPSSIRKKLAEQQDVRLYLTFNGRGEVYNIVFRGQMQDGIPLTDEQWTKVFDSLRKLSTYLVQLTSLDDSGWEVRGAYPVSQYLRESGN